MTCGWILSFLVFLATTAKTYAAPGEFPREIVLEQQLLAENSFLARRNWNLTILSNAFLKEPELSKQHIYRQYLKLGSDTNEAVAFIWDRLNGKLYLDLNRNLDLTDDPTGVFRALPSGSRFTNVVITPKSAQILPVTMNLELNGDLQGKRFYITAVLRSFWQAKLNFGGHVWQMGLIDNASDPPDLSASYLVLRPWEEHTNRLYTGEPSSGLSPFTSRLYWEGQAFHVSRRCENGTKGTIGKLVFTPEEPPMVPLNLSGEYVNRVLLCDSNGYTVLLHEPKSDVKIPKGDYLIRAVWLKSGSVTAIRNAYQPEHFTATNAARLVLGGPLTNSVQLQRTGKTLQMGYRLIGADTNSYQIIPINNEKPPEFAVFRGDKKIASGKFRFG